MTSVSMPGADRVIEARRIGAVGDDDRDRRIEPLLVQSRR